jgi:hypothetical protein
MLCVVLRRNLLFFANWRHHLLLGEEREHG